MPAARPNGNPLRSSRGMPAAVCECCDGETVYLQAWDCDGQPIDLWRTRGAFQPWGGALPWPYWFLAPDGRCGRFQDGAAASTTPGTILAGDVQIADCADERCFAEDVYVQSRRCAGGGLRNVFKRRDDFQPWGGPLPWPYRWLLQTSQVPPNPCGYFDDTCPTTTNPGPLLTGEEEIDDCADVRCVGEQTPGACDTTGCPPSVTVIISGVGVAGLDGVHSLPLVQNGLYRKVFNQALGWQITFGCGVTSTSGRCRERWSMVAVNGVEGEDTGARIDGYIDNTPCARCPPSGMLVTTGCSVTQQGVTTECTGTATVTGGDLLPCDPCE